MVLFYRFLQRIRADKVLIGGGYIDGVNGNSTTS